jgi:hypothetical protein
MTYTQEQKKEYFASLREKWQANKALAEGDTVAHEKYMAIVAEAPDNRISYYSFYFTLQSMRAHEYDGTPYIDCKTFAGWVNAGFRVKKGEKSHIDGITWLQAKNKDGSDADMVYPKMYHLFHRSQVEEIIK